MAHWSCYVLFSDGRMEFVAAEEIEKLKQQTGAGMIGVVKQ